MRTPLAALLALLAAVPLSAQGTRSTQADTSLTMVGDQVLVTHTVARTRDGVESGMNRSDGLTGSARSEFDQDLPRHYAVKLAKADTSVALDVERRGGRLVISGTRTGTVSIPRNVRWAVADVGMEEHLIPALRTIPEGTRGLPVAVFRPSADRWDQLRASVYQVAGAMLIQLHTETGDASRFLVTETGDLLYVETQPHGSQTTSLRRVPSAGSRRDERLQDLLVLARSQGTPSGPERQAP
ncbi:MAG TPA: hypothetical protein VF613_17655 [Longimicrobium sp.]|jgi:hypothetical protein